MKTTAIGFSLLLAPFVSLASGCARERALVPLDEIESERTNFDSSVESEAETTLARLFAGLKREHDDHAAGRAARHSAPTFDVLVVSGGGDWGAFGAGVLKGWGRVTDSALARPTFDIVTGVSTGALIAPFAFLGDDASIERIVGLYRNPAPDWVKSRGFLGILFGKESFATIPGLERDMRAIIDREFISRIADAGRSGRLMFVSTTNVDFGEVHAFEMVSEAERALATGDTDRFHLPLFASSAIPGAFPPREIDGHLYVDGAMTGNILYGARLTGDKSLPARWKRLYPGVPMPKTRYWVVFNNQFRFPPEVTQPVLGSLITRSLFISTQQATVAAIRHLFAQSRLDADAHGVEIEVRVVSIDEAWRAKTPGTFLHETMNDLADMGERMGADPASWRTVSP